MNGGKPGIVYLVGAGPGDAGLITLKGVRCLEKAEVVIYDFLADPALLSHAPATSEKINVGKSVYHHTMEQREINTLLVNKGREGGVVVRLKGGDPFVFGRGGEECEALHAAGIPFEVVPGVTAGIAAPAYAGIPVTSRGCASSVAFVTGNEDPAKPYSTIRWEHLAQGADTLVFYMGVGNLAGITAELMRHGRSSATPVAIVRWGTKSTQRTITGTLATIVETAESTSLLPPAIIIVGEVVALRDRLHWFENRPLSGKRIINTRSRAQASQLSVLLTDLGAEVLELPTIAVEPAGRESALAAEIENLEGYQWIVFTSANGVHAFFNLLLAIKGDIRGLGSARLASIGPGTTAAINGYRIRVDCTASEAVAEGLLAALDAYTWEGVRVLLPRAARARDLLPDALRARGAAVTVAAAYTTVTPESVDESIKDAILHDRYDLITFSSPSTFENFAGLFGASGFAEIARTLRAISIGPVTTAAMALSGVTPVAQAREHTIPGIAATIREYLQK